MIGGGKKNLRQKAKNNDFTFILLVVRFQLGNPQILGFAIFLQIATLLVYLQPGGDKLHVGGQDALWAKTNGYNILSKNH